MPFVQRCEILENEEIAPEHFRVRFHAPEMAREAGPAQFCMIQVQDGYYPLLRRPMSFEQIDSDSVTVLYKLEGEGTRMLSRHRPGATVSVQGPLGKGFPLEGGFERHIRVAGGIGIAPFPALAKALVEKLSVNPEIVIAARTADYALREEYLHDLGCRG